MDEATLDVVAIGNAIVDIIAHADDSFLAQHGMAKGGMALIDEAAAHRLYEAAGPAAQLSGGSAGNTIAGLASLGVRAGYIGKVRNDALGDVFRHDIAKAGVRFPTAAASDGPSTARCLIFVTPDAQRTMNTYLGACVNLTPDDIDADLVRAAKVTYLEGYLYDPPQAQEAFRKAAAIAHESGRKVALSLSDSFCVERHRDAFLRLVDRDVDILFANEAEITALFGVKTVAEAGRNLHNMVDLAAVTCGADGSALFAKGQTVKCPAAPVAQLVDTTGAGDLYAAGFLYGLIQDLPLAECGRLGGLAAAEIISHYGGRAETPLAQYIAAT